MGSRSPRHNSSFHRHGSWFRAMAFAVGVVGGLVSMLTSPSPSRRPVRRRSASMASGHIPAAALGDFTALRTTIFGYSKREVVRVLGPPPTALLGDAPPSGEAWLASTWYYPFDARRHTAIAVQFDDDNDRVIRVDQIGGLI